MIIQCPDQEDEADCDILILPKDYSNLLPPPTQDRKPLPISFSLAITAVRQFNLLDYSCSIDTTITLKWKDSRLDKIHYIFTDLVVLFNIFCTLLLIITLN